MILCDRCGATIGVNEFIIMAPTKDDDAGNIIACKGCNAKFLAGLHQIKNDLDLELRARRDKWYSEWLRLKTGGEKL